MSATRPIAIAVVGYGRAGQARARDARASARVTLAGVVSRRPEHATVSFEAALADPEVAAVAICTENALHERQVREALGAGKHVLVEYPMCLGGAGPLFAAARERGVVLHEEHIELLSPAYEALRRQVAAAGALRRARFHFQGSAAGWIGDRARAGFPSYSGIARLHRIVDLFGPVAVQEAAIVEGEGGFRMEAHLATRGGAPVVWVEERGLLLSRAHHLRIELEGGTITALPGGSAGPVFAADLERFAREVAGERDAGPDEARILHCFEVAREIEARASM